MFKDGEFPETNTRQPRRRVPVIQVSQMPKDDRASCELLRTELVCNDVDICHYYSVWVF
jgi:hypothetical protein